MNRPQARPFCEWLHDLIDDEWPTHAGGELHVRHLDGRITIVIVPPYRPPPIRRYLPEESDGLNQMQRDVLQAVAEHFETEDAEPLVGEKIAERSGYDYTGRFRQMLADLIRMNRLKRGTGGRGYEPAER
jgi:hypothetical protein